DASLPQHGPKYTECPNRDFVRRRACRQVVPSLELRALTACCRGTMMANVNDKRSRRCAGVAIVLALGASLSVAAPCAAGAHWQDRAAPDASIASRLAAIQRALFSGTADPRAIIGDLQAILAIDEQSRDAHL